MSSGYIKAFRELTRLIVKHRYICYEMARREIVDKYSGQIFGSIWALVHPAFVMLFYAFIFGYVFKIKVTGLSKVDLDYTSYILSGLIPWLAFIEILTKSSTVITSNSSLVKQFIFPLEILPIKGVLATIFSHVVYVGFYIVYAGLYHKIFHWTFLLIPILVALHVSLLIGVSFILSVIGVYFRDLKDFLQLFGMVGLYLLPVIYFPGSIPALFNKVLYVNPASYIIWCYQDVFFYGGVRHPLAWIIFPTISMLVFITGYMFFKRFRSLLGSVL